MATLCLGCMRTKEESPVCEHCGYDDRQDNLVHQLPVGTLLQNQYLVGSVLGQGGFGITYLGWDQHLSIPVAIKEYFPSGVVQRHTKMGTRVWLANGEEPELFRKHSARFLKEARVLAQLSDIGEIVQIKSFFSGNDTAYIVMEYVQGITLKDHLKKLGRAMTESEALAIMEPVLKALQKVHDHGLIHRDISPDNIMLPDGGGIKLIDFGTVRYIDDSGKSKSTEAVLKPGFAPMEQYNTRGNLGTWTDVYAICATFHYLLTGKVPPEVMERMDQQETLPLLRSQQNLSPHLIQALESGMRLRISDRVQTIEQLYGLLYAPSEDVVLQEPIATEKKPVSPQKRKKSPFIPVLAAVLVLLAGAYLLIPKKNVTDSSSQTAPVSALSPGPSGQKEELADFSDPETMYRRALSWADEGYYGRAAVTLAKLGDYQDSREQAFNLWAKVPGRKTISFYDYYDPAGGRYIEMIHAIRKNGTIAADTTFSDSLSPDAIQNYAASAYQGIVSIHGIIGLRFDGTLALPEGDSKYLPLADWTDIISLSVYESSDILQCIGLKADGTVVYTGSASFDTKALGKWTDIQAVACGENIVAGLKFDGSVVCAASDPALQDTLSRWTGIRSIAVSGDQVLGLKADSTVVSSNGSQWSEGNIVTLTDNPSGICADGTVVTEQGALAGWNDIVDMAGRNWQSAGLKKDGSLVFTADGYGFYENAKNWIDILLPDEVIADPQVLYTLAQSLEAEGSYPEAAIAYGKADDYLDAQENSIRLWHKNAPRKTISAGSGCNAMVKSNGTVAFSCVRDPRQYGVNSWKDIQSISAGYSQTVGLKADGTVVAVGNNQTGLCNVADWSDIIAIDASTTNTLGLKADGTVLAAGNNSSGQCNVADWTRIVAISASTHSVGLRNDGTVVAVGSNQNGQCNVSRWTDIKAVSSASYNAAGITVGLKSDGTVVTAGNFGAGQPDVSGWKDIIAVDAGVGEEGAFVAGLKSDGTVVTSGLDDSSVSQWSGIVAISANDFYLLGLKEDGTMVSAGTGNNGAARVSQLSDIQIP